LQSHRAGGVCEGNLRRMQKRPLALQGAEWPGSPEYTCCFIVANLSVERATICQLCRIAVCFFGALEGLIESSASAETRAGVRQTAGRANVVQVDCERVAVVRVRVDVGCRLADVALCPNPGGKLLLQWSRAVSAA